MTVTQESRTYPSLRDTANRIGICLCIMIALMQGGNFFWTTLDLALRDRLPAEHAYFCSVLIETISYLSYFMIPALLFAPLSRGREREPIRFDTRMPAYSPLLVLSGVAFTYAVAQFNGWLMDRIGYGVDSVPVYSGGNDPLAIALFITVSLAPAFCEEFLFRGVVYGNLRRFGVPFAGIVSSLLFALMHENIAQTIYTFAGGIALALCYELSGSIWCGTFLHLFNNLLSCVSEILLARMGEDALPVLYITDGCMLGLGVISTLILLFLYRKNQRQPDTASGGSLIGRLPESLPPTPVVHVKAGTVVSGLLAPGMIVYVAVEIAITALNAAMVYGGF